MLKCMCKTDSNFCFYFATSDSSYHVTPTSSSYSQSGPVPQQQQQQQIPTGGQVPLRKVINMISISLGAFYLSKTGSLILFSFRTKIDNYVNNKYAVATARQNAAATIPTAAAGKYFIKSSHTQIQVTTFSLLLSDLIRLNCSMISK